jgi:hypothetical protein
LQQQMKKVFFAILSLVYLAVSSGAALNIHYCMGRVTQVAYRFTNSRVCDRCGMANKKGCCHNEFKFVKLTDDQQKAKADIALAAVHAILPATGGSQLQPEQGITIDPSMEYNSPPDKRVTSIYLHDSVFRI